MFNTVGMISVQADSTKLGLSETMLPLHLFYCVENKYNGGMTFSGSFHTKMKTISKYFFSFGLGQNLLVEIIKTMVGIYDYIGLDVHGKRKYLTCEKNRASCLFACIVPHIGLAKHCISRCKTQRGCHF